MVNRTVPDAELYLYGTRERQDDEKISDLDEYHSITPLFENIQQEGIRIK